MQALILEAQDAGGGGAAGLGGQVGNLQQVLRGRGACGREGGWVALLGVWERVAAVQAGQKVSRALQECLPATILHSDMPMGRLLHAPRLTCLLLPDCLCHTAAAAAPGWQLVDACCACLISSREYSPGSTPTCRHTPSRAVGQEQEQAQRLVGSVDTGLPAVA